MSSSRDKSRAVKPRGIRGRKGGREGGREGGRKGGA